MTDSKYAPHATIAADSSGELGYAPMDRIHHEFEALLRRARSTGSTDWVQLLSDIDAHLRSHFEAEDRWMLGTEFPARECHMDEHNSVLKSSAEVLGLARRGNSNAAPSFVTSLAEWFPGHAHHLDSALAAWMCTRQFGGRPIVLHRHKNKPPLD